MKTVKKILLSSLSVLGVSLLVWTVFLLNPQLSYASETQFDNVTVYHNMKLEQGTQQVLRDAINTIKHSNIYDDNINIELCLNDDKIFPSLYPFAGATAYAYFNKTVIYASEPNFDKDYTEFKWEINNYEARRYNLSTLLAHEFMHNLQSNQNAYYYIKSTLGSRNWKFEGHAEYIARAFKNDGQLKSKIEKYLLEEAKDHNGVPVFQLADGTIQNLSYFKYALVVQYVMEEKGMDYQQLCDLKTEFDDLYAEMVEWSK